MKFIEKNLNIRKNEPLIGFSNIARIVASEGCVLLKNDQALPINNEEISIFGRIQLNYYKSGTGSGGLVNVIRVTSILDGLLQNPFVRVNQDLLNAYKNWVTQNPFSIGSGMWASEPWSQEEMELSDEIVETASKKTNKAIIIIGRTAGEDRDNLNVEGSFLLTKKERQMIKKVSESFKKTIVVLNVGNIIDTSFINEYKIDALLYAWHGGMEGGRAISDVLTGITTPSGKLTDTIAQIDDYPSKSFGNKDKNFYEEDIYVGYRYFNTFKPDKIIYPFGYGLSYTTFTIKHLATNINDYIVETMITVENIGDFKGKETPQIYLSAPQGKLGHPKVELVCFQKTKLLEKNERVTITLRFDLRKTASYDDYGHIKKSAYVLEEGQYNLYLGTDSIHTTLIHEFKIDTNIIIEELSEVAAPYEGFKRIKPHKVNNTYEISSEDVPTKTTNLHELMLNNMPRESIKTKRRKTTLLDVYKNKISVDDFVAQLSNHELACLTRGEGMSSPKVTPGVAGCFGGVTKDLLSYGIPLVACADGPSGIRMDSGKRATSLPNGTALACTMNPCLVESLFYLEGVELNGYNIDLLLGPGINIHRSPLNGRNFEYLSEDPLVTGVIGSAIVKGIEKGGGIATIKHFACNNQEYKRADVNSIVSERALREIYLRPFEIIVKTASPTAIMTAYNPINNIWAASNFELNTLILRNEWNFKGIVMTDWWPKMNEEGTEPSFVNTKAMIKSQNDIYMVTRDAQNNEKCDNTMISLENNELSKAEIQRVAKNICEFLIQTPAFIKTHKLPKRSFNHTKWFEYIEEPLEFPIIKTINIKKSPLIDFNPLKNVYYIKDNYTDDISYKTKEKNASIYKKDKTITIMLSNSNYYTLVFETEETKEKNFDATDIIPDEYILIDKEVKIVFNEIKPCYTTSAISIKDFLTFSARGEIISYAFETIEEGEFIFAMSMSSTSLLTSQIPFTIIINNDRTNTIIASGTEGIKKEVFQKIKLPKGRFIFSINFNKTGMLAYDFSIKKVED